FFFFSILRPPNPPLFPYTTLFRSFSASASRCRSSQVSGRSFSQETALLPHWHQPRRSAAMLCSSGTRAGLLFGPATVQAWPAQTDRKSTRLNSSHDQISYAVFCLK